MDSSFSQSVETYDVDFKEFGEMHKQAEWMLQIIFHFEQFTLLQRELQYWLDKIDVKECTVTTIINNEEIEIKDIRCVAKNIIQTVIEIHYPALQEIHWFVSMHRNFYGQIRKQLAFKYWSLSDDTYTIKQIQQWIHYLAQPYDSFNTLREVLSKFLLDILHQYHCYNSWIEFVCYDPSFYVLTVCQNNLQDLVEMEVALNFQKQDYIICKLRNGIIQNNIEPLIDNNKFVIY
eukprot:101159_1